MNQKIYRHYTGYPGGLKEILMKDLVEKDPAEIIRRAVKGMMPNNTIRGIILERNLIVHEGPYHDHLAQKLPQFIPQIPLDINKELDVKTLTKDDATVIFESNPDKTPQEFKDIPRDIDESIATPIPWEKKTHKYTKASMRKSRVLQ